MLAFFILVDVECLGTESGSKQETQPDLHIIKDLELLLLSAANGEQFQIPEALSSYMEGDVDQACLKTQLLMIPDMIKTAFDGSIKKVTIMRTLTGAMNKSEIYKDMLSEVDKLLKIYFTFPVTSATAKRTFSSLQSPNQNIFTKHYGSLSTE